MPIAHLYGDFGKEENTIVSRQGLWLTRPFTHIPPHNHIPLFSAQLSQLYMATLMVVSLKLFFEEGLSHEIGHSFSVSIQS